MCVVGGVGGGKGAFFILSAGLVVREDDEVEVSDDESNRNALSLSFFGNGFARSFQLSPLFLSARQTRFSHRKHRQNLTLRVEPGDVLVDLALERRVSAGICGALGAVVGLPGMLVLLLAGEGRGCGLGGSSSPAPDCARRHGCRKGARRTRGRRTGAARERTELSAMNDETLDLCCSPVFAL